MCLGLLGSLPTYQHTYIHILHVIVNNNIIIDSKINNG